MAKRVDPLAAKKAKQKKLAIILSVLLVGVVAFQGPKTLKMMKGPPATTAAASNNPCHDAGPHPACCGSRRARARGGPRRLRRRAERRERRAALDRELLDEGPVRAAGRGGGSDPDRGRARRLGAADRGGETPTPSSDVPPGTFDPLGSNPRIRTRTRRPEHHSTGRPARPRDRDHDLDQRMTESVNPEASFPAADPAFVLEALAADGKSAEISVAGGSYTNGKETITLQIGKQLTLQNTSDGSRYDLSS